MIEETGTVMAIDGNVLWVEVIRRSACESCSQQAGCGQSVLSRISRGRASRVAVANTIKAEVGDDVVLGIAEAALLSASLRVYLLPLLMMLGAATAVSVLTRGHEGYVSLAAVLGLAGGFWLARQSFQRGPSGRFAPVVLRRCLSRQPAADTNLSLT